MTTIRAILTTLEPPELAPGLARRIRMRVHLRRARWALIGFAVALVALIVALERFIPEANEFELWALLRLLATNLEFSAEYLQDGWAMLVEAMPASAIPTMVATLLLIPFAYRTTKLLASSRGSIQ